jgi:RNA polymerase sigma-70 factor (ECF subfamily)
VPEPDETADETLVAGARAGERAAFEALVRRYQKPVYRLCFRYVRDHDEAADLTQRTFVRVMGRLGDLRQGELFRTWLFRIGVNLALNHIRDNARFVEEPPEGLDPALAVTAVGVSRLVAGELATALRKAVEALPTKQRMTLELRIYEELSFRDIALALGTSEGAAKVNFHYAVRKLRSRLGPAEELETRGSRP